MGKHALNSAKLCMRPKLMCICNTEVCSGVLIKKFPEHFPMSEVDTDPVSEVDSLRRKEEVEMPTRSISLNKDRRRVTFRKFINIR
jgi:hypothetical protein